MEWLNLTHELPQLSAGAHEENSGQLCAMEMIAYLEQLPHSDAPPCTHELIRNWIIGCNDGTDIDSTRNMIWPYLPQAINTLHLNTASLIDRALHTFFSQVIPYLVPLSSEREALFRNIPLCNIKKRYNELWYDLPFRHLDGAYLDLMASLDRYPIKNLWELRSLIGQLAAFQRDTYLERQTSAMKAKLMILDAMLDTQPAKPIDRQRVEEAAKVVETTL